MAVVGEAYIIVRPITTGFESSVSKDLQKLEGVASRVGSSSGAAFSSSFARSMSKIGVSSDFAGKIESQGKALYALQAAGITTGSVISELLGSVAALAGGVVALGGALLSAAPAALALGAGLVDIGIGALTAKLALGGISRAVTLLNRQQSKASQDNTAGLRREADAQKALLRVIETNADALIKADKNIEDASQKTTKAQEALNVALKDGKEQLQQIGFDAESAALAEKRAGLDLEKAREGLARVQDLPPNSRARREAQLAYAEADLNLRRAKDKNSDLAKEQERLAKTGVEGLDSVVAAREAAAQADAALSDTKLAKTAAETDALRKQKDAQEQVDRAIADNAKAKSGVGKGIDPLANLSESQKEFAKFIVGLKSEFLGLKEAAASSFLPPLKTAIQTLVKDLFPTLKTGLKEVGTGLGDMANKIADAVVTPVNLEKLSTAFSNASVAISKLGDTAGSLWGIVLSVLVAVDPLLQKFLTFLNTKLATLDEKLNANPEKLKAFFAEAGRVAAELGKIIGNIASGLGNIIKANTGPGTGGQIMLDYFKDITGAFKAFSGSEAGQNQLKSYFAGAAENTKAILSSVGGFVKELLKLGSDPNIKKFWDIIGTAAPAFGDILAKSNEAAPSMGRLFVTIVKILDAFTQTSTVQVFFDTLNTIASVILAIFDNKIIKAIMDFTAPFHGFALALFAVTTLFSQFGAGLLYLAAKPLTMAVEGFSKLKGAVGFLKNPMATLTPLLESGGMLFRGLATAAADVAASFGLALGPFLAIVAVVAAVVAIFVLAYKNSKDLRDAISGLVDAVGGALGDAFNKIKDAIGPLATGFSGLSDVFRAIGDFLAKYVVPIFQILLVGAINTLADSIVLAINIVKGLWRIFNFDPLPALKAVFDAVVGFLAGLGARFAKGAGNLWGWLTDGLRGAVNIVLSLINTIIGYINKISFKIPDIYGVPDRGKQFGIHIDPIKPLAEGGVVMPSYGGTLARIGEAGRPERVEPLDPDGLSKRDKAMIKVLAGDTVGTTINVYPSAGMNESELASMVSRQIAFQMRKGGA